MKKLCVTYPIAQLLKEVGYNLPTIYMYDKLEMFGKDLKTFQEFTGVNYNSSAYCVSAPTLDEVVEWLEDEYNISTSVLREYKIEKKYTHEIVLQIEGQLNVLGSNQIFDSRIKAKRDMIIHALEFVKERKKNGSN